MLLLVLPCLQLIERQSDKQCGNDDIDHVPYGTAEVDFHKRLKEEGQRGKDDREGDFLLVEVVPGDESECRHGDEPDEGVGTIGEMEEAGKEDDCK